MKIIKQGKLPEEIEFQVECSNCTTIFSFAKKEARISYSEDNRDPYTLLTVACPLCKKTVEKYI